MLQLKNKWGSCPPDGYRYVFPEDGYVSHAWTYVDWVADAQRHCHINKYPWEGMEEKMQQQYCMTLPPGFCDYDDDNRPRPKANLEWGDVVGGMAVFARWIASGCKTAEQKEVDRRALVCSRCYLNVNISGCVGCQKLVAEVVHNKSSKYDFALRGCAVCQCVLKAKVHFPLQNLLDSEDQSQQEMYPSHCWLKKGGENYREVVN
jgi:hypothetical protein